MPQIIPFVVQAVVTAAVSFAVGYVAQAIFAPSRKPVGSIATAKTRSSSAGSRGANDALAVTAEPGGPQIGLFGRRRVGGRVVLSAKSDVDSKTYLAIVLAGSPVTSISATFINDKVVALNVDGKVTTSPWATGDSIKIKYYDGTQTAADADLVAAFPGWTDDSIGAGNAYVRIIIDASGNAAAFSAGVPDFTFDVEGFKCYDPRDEAHDIDDSATWTFSRNAAIINANYLIHELGAALPTSDVDWTSVATAADVCDEIVDTLGGGTEARYECAVRWLTDERHETVLDRIGAAHAGGAFLVGKKWRLATGVFGTVTATIDPNDYVAGGLEFSDYKPLSELVNGVRGTFSSPVHHYEPRDFPAYQDATALAADGRELWLDLDLETVVSASQAQRLARIAYNKARNGFPASVQLAFKHFDTVADDMISLTDDLAGFTAKTFRVTADELGDEFTVTLELEHEASTFYDWTAATDEKPFEQYPPLQGGGSSGGTGYTAFRDPTALVKGGGVLFGVNYAVENDVPFGAGTFDFRVVTPRVTIWASPSAVPLRYYVEFTLKTHSGGVHTSTATNTQNTTSGSVTSSKDVESNDYSIGTASDNGTYALKVRMYTKNTDTGEITARSTIRDVTKAKTIAGTDALVDELRTVDASSSNYYILPAGAVPEVTASDGTNLTINVAQAAGVKSTHLELWVSDTAEPSTATLVGNAANGAGGANFNFTIIPGTSRYFWSYVKNNSAAKYGPQSSPLLVVFS